MIPAMYIDGVTCMHCGSPDLRVIAPGTEAERHDLIGLLQREVRIRAWCCFEHAREGAIAPDNFQPTEARNG
jgi:hypothetical protein